MVAVGETTRYVGDVLAQLWPKSDAIARQAAAAHQSRVRGAGTADRHARSAQSRTRRKFTTATAICWSQSVTSRGDVAEAEAESAYIAQGVFETQWIEHGFMEPETAVAYPNGQTITSKFSPKARASTMTASKLPSCWAWPLEKVRVILCPTAAVLAARKI